MQPIAPINLQTGHAEPVGNSFLPSAKIYSVGEAPPYSLSGLIVLRIHTSSADQMSPLHIAADATDDAGAQRAMVRKLGGDIAQEIAAGSRLQRCG